MTACVCIVTWSATLIVPTTRSKFDWLRDIGSGEYLVVLDAATIEVAACCLAHRRMSCLDVDKQQFLLLPWSHSLRKQTAIVGVNRHDKVECSHIADLKSIAILGVRLRRKVRQTIL